MNIHQVVNKLTTVTEEQKRRLIAGLLFGGLCGLLAAVQSVEYMLISGAFAVVYAGGIVGGYKVWKNRS